MLNEVLVGGNSNIFHFHPDPWRNDPIWLICFEWVEATNQICWMFCWMNLSIFLKLPDVYVFLRLDVCRGIMKNYQVLMGIKLDANVWYFWGIFPVWVGNINDPCFVFSLSVGAIFCNVRENTNKFFQVRCVIFMGWFSHHEIYHLVLWSVPTIKEVKRTLSNFRMMRWCNCFVDLVCLEACHSTLVVGKSSDLLYELGPKNYTPWIKHSPWK